MEKTYEHKSKRIHTNNHKKEECFTNGVFFNKIIGMPKGRDYSGLVSLENLIYADSTRTETPLSALFMVFGYHIKHIAPLLDFGTKVIMLADPNIDDFEIIKSQENKEKNLRLLWAKKDLQFRNSAFHPKLYLIKFASILRVVIGSANLFLEDWTKWSNVCWVRDFQYKGDGSTSKNLDFKRQLETFIKSSMGEKFTDLKNFLNIDLKDFEFNKTGVELLYSLPTKRTLYEGDSCGLELLQKIMEKHKPSRNYEFKDTKIYYSCSCVGAINFGIVYQFITAIAPNLKSDKLCDFKQQKKYFTMLKLIYPTQSYINGLMQKNNDTACLFFNKRIYDKVNFNQSILAQFDNNEHVYGDENFISHSKIFIVMRSGIVDDDTVIYIGSHNFTKSAWGKISRQRYEISNHELGVLYPPETNSAELKRELINKFSFKVPAPKYDDEDIPFFTVDK